MRKQIGFDVISENVGSEPQKQILLGRVQRYLDAGWEVIGTHVPQTGTGTITITVVLAKYEHGEVGSVGESETLTGETKRGPGRPKKAEEVVPA
jgi:hypothetical protein